MADHQKVRGGHEISVRVVDLLEDMRPQLYNGTSRAETVRTINDILHGRTERTVDSFLAGLRNTGGEDYAARVEEVSRDIQAFGEQKALLCQPYTKTSDTQYDYKIVDYVPTMPLKYIDQKLYDRAAKDGFPPDFFRDSYFDSVTFYCVPDGQDCSGSIFIFSVFSVCRLRNISFEKAFFQSSEFQTCLLEGVAFQDTTLAFTHFHDCSLKRISFQNAQMRKCNTIDCTMDGMDFLNARMDGAFFGRVTPSGIKNLDTAAITEGGATAEEVKRLRASIFDALQVPDLSVVQRPKASHRKPHRAGPER